VIGAGMSIVSALCDRSAKARLLFLSFWRWANYTHANPRIHGLGFFVAGLGTVGVAMLLED
jgi:hypothetical protein